MKAVDKYKNRSIETSDPGKIVVALYDGFIKQANIAKEALRQGERARAGEAISQAIAIVGELHASLDGDKGDEQLADRLASIYMFVNDELLQANRENDPERLEDLIDLMSGLREAWQEASMKVKDEGLEPDGG
jgi:flagellar protein FliS